MDVITVDIFDTQRVDAGLGGAKLVQGPRGEPGAVYVPAVTDGVLSWTNDGGLENPQAVTDALSSISDAAKQSKDNINDYYDSIHTGIATLIDYANELGNSDVAIYLSDLLVANEAGRKQELEEKRLFPLEILNFDIFRELNFVYLQNSLFRQTWQPFVDFAMTWQK